MVLFYLSQSRSECLIRFESRVAGQSVAMMRSKAMLAFIFNLKNKLKHQHNSFLFLNILE